VSRPAAGWADDPPAISTLVAFSRTESDLRVALPPLAREVWRLAMQTPERQLINPFFTGSEVTRVLVLVTRAVSRSSSR